MHTAFKLTSDKTNNNTSNEEYFDRMDILRRKKHEARYEIQYITKYQGAFSEIWISSINAIRAISIFDQV